MNEQAVRSVVLMQTIESADSERQILSDDDRLYASRSANELAQWEAADKRVVLGPELFLKKRAEQILKKILERHPGLARSITGKNRFLAIGWGLPLLAFLSGALLDRVSDTHRVDLLSGPLLLIIVWNFLVYILLLAQLIFPGLGRNNFAGLKRMAVFALSASARLPRATPAPLAAAIGKFSAEWLALSAPLLRARAARIMHVSALGFSLGVIVSLYVRGILSQYVAGWESTFLNPVQVHAILSLVFMPVQQLFSLSGFSLAQVQALQLPQGLSSSDGALWVHLYAGTLLIVVLIPRLMLAMLAYWQETRLRNTFPLNLAQAYFQKLTANIGPALQQLMRVFPYSFTLDEVRDNNLSVVAKMMLGETVRVILRPSTGYGEELHDALKKGAADKKTKALTVVLFNLTATPEQENHGAFLSYFLRDCGENGIGLVVLLDESAYLERVGGQAGGEQRVHERIQLWRQFCARHHVTCMLVNLLHPQIRADEIALASLNPDLSL